MSKVYKTQIQVAKTILEQVKHRPILEVIEYIEAEIMTMEIKQSEATQERKESNG